MNPPSGVARILLIADDPDSGLLYRDALAAGGYQVVQAQSFIEAFDSSMTDICCSRSARGTENMPLLQAIHRRS